MGAQEGRGRRVAVQALDVELLEAPHLAAFNLDLPTAGSVEQGYNLTLSGWALAPSGPPRSVRLTLTGSSVMLDGVLAESRLLGFRHGVGDHFAEIPRASESNFLFYCSLIGLPRESKLVLSAQLHDERSIPMARLRVRRDVISVPTDRCIQPVLLYSPGRSGSTWLTRLLGQHPQGVTYRPFQREPRVTSYWMEAFRALSGPTGYSRAIHPERTESRDWWIVDRDWLPQMDVADDPHLQRWLVEAAVEDMARFCRGRIEGFYGSVARDENKGRPEFFAERAVSARLTAMAREFFPRLTELQLMRDPRDILVSRLAYIARTKAEQFGRETADSDEEYVRESFSREMRNTLQRWKAAGPESILVRYEDLIQRPEDQLREIFERLEVDSDPATVSQVLTAARLRSPDRQREHMTTTPEEQSIGRWRRDLGAPLLAAFEESLGDVIGEFGYS